MGGWIICVLSLRYFASLYLKKPNTNIYTGKCLRAHGHQHRDGLGVPCCFLPKATQLCCVCLYAVRRAGIEASFPSSLVPDDLYRALKIQRPGMYKTDGGDKICID